ncbi:MAG: electron transfer flavoprotein subunit alpha/FixB family protein [Thermomicrobiales bacterium]|nr:electron transfer flavoprotein subunit alpha/FixB family protein [Thermomicrobiales bacterium]
MPTGSGVLVVGEVDASGAPRPISWEVLAAAKSVAGVAGGGVTALLMGSGIADAARAWGSAGADRVLTADAPEFAGLLPAVAAAAVTEAIQRTNPAVVLMPGTTSGRDYAPLVAARLKAGLAADCVELHEADGTLTATRPVLGGRALTRVTFPDSQPAMITIRAGSFAKAGPGATSPEVEPFVVTLAPDDLRVSMVELAAKGAVGSRLDSAAVVVSGGRGLKEPANFALVEELAESLGGAVGATRAVVDAGWRPHHEQIGQTGRTVSPRLYVAVGVSGAVQHNVGMQGSEQIVAINRDPDAPIFKIASFGIVGDLFEVVPALTAAIRDARS